MSTCLKVLTSKNLLDRQKLREVSLNHTIDNRHHLRMVEFLGLRPPSHLASSATALLFFHLSKDVFEGFWFLAEKK